MSPLPLLVSLPETEESLEILAEELEFTAGEQVLAKSMLADRLPPLVKPSCLPFLFAISHQLIGLMEKSPHLFYRRFVARKTGGGFREIKAPRRYLKIIQQWIQEHILLKGTLPDNVKGFVKGQSIFSNAKVHAKNRNLMVIDVSNFFPSITFAQVEAVFGDFGYPNRVQHQLTALCCLDGHLPQGAPTSPSLANLVFKPVDEELSKLAKKWKCDYTRYADDLAFSGSRAFSKLEISHAEKILNRFGFSLNKKKSRIIGQGGRQVIAGLVVNNNALPPRVRRRRWRATFHRASKYPKEFMDRVHTLLGIASFVNQFSPQTAAKYRDIARKVLQLQ